MKWLAAAIVFSTLTACGEDAFVCRNDAECSRGDVDGSCELSGYCSFPDGICPSGRRYGELAGGGLADTCVEPMDPSATGGPTSGASGSGSSGTSGSPTGGATTSGSPTTGPGPTTDPVTTGPVAECGNAAIEPGEDCEGNDLGGAACATVGFDGGDLACGDDCRFDVSACTRCGDGTIDRGESCDEAQLAGTTCQDLGFFAGEVACTEACTFDASGCTNCGDGALDPDEVCDGTTEVSCTSLGLEAGTLGCAADCSTFDASECGPPTCGVDPSESFTECPEVCDSCAEGECLIDCDGVAACSGAEIVCPPGWPCRVRCTGTSTCSNADIRCPDFSSCAVECDGTSGCSGAQIACSLSGSCSLTCGDSTSTCSGTQLECGLDACSAQCADDSTPEVACNGSCDCTPCP